jgi:pimeloyl-ACP methyl ester carboxylesterase
MLVLLPGLDGTGKLFRPFVEALGDLVATEVVSYPADEPLGYEELEARVCDLLQRDRPFVLLGESFSGPIAIRIAARSPLGLKGVILCGTFARNPFPGLGWTWPLARYLPLKSLPRWVRAPLMWGSKSPSRATSRVDRAMSGVSASVIRKRLAALLVVDATDALRQIRVPVLVLRAQRDWVVPRKATEVIMKARPASMLVEIDGPHLLLQTRPAEAAAAVVAFMNRIV